MTGGAAGRTILRAVGAGALLLFAACAGNPPAPFTPGAERYHFQCDVTRSMSDESRFTVRGLVRDDQARRDIQVPPFTVEKGRPAHGVGTDPATGARVTFEVLVDESGRSAAWRGELTVDGALTASRSDTVVLVN